MKDNLVHVIGIEATLLGRPTPEVMLPDDLPHVRNDLGRSNEQWIEAYRGRSTADVLADLRRDRRPAGGHRGHGPGRLRRRVVHAAGPDSYGRFMRIRVMDMWMHEQDIREAVGRPGHEEGLAPQAALDELTAALGFVVGKRAGAPAGSRVRFELTGPMARRIDVAVAERARVVDALDGEPTVTLTLPGTFHPSVRRSRGRPGGGRRRGRHPAGRGDRGRMGFMI